MNILEDLQYTKEHEWIKIDGNTATVGITDFAQSELGEIVYVEVDTVGESIAKDEIFGTIEAVKTTSDLFIPVSGKILEFNPKLNEDGDDQPDLVNSDPYGEGWIVKIELENEDELADLMSADDYKALIG